METFDDFLALARAQADAQRLLLVFTNIDQVAGQSASSGGYLTPKMCVDKTPNEIENFTALVNESANTGQTWSVVFVASLAGKGTRAPSSEDANKPLDAMIAGINTGMIHPYLAFNKEGEILSMMVQE